MCASSPSCIFCKIIRNEIPSPRVYEDAEFICIRDIQPHAQTHLLVIPKDHIASLAEAFPGLPHATARDSIDPNARFVMLGKLMELGTQIARQQGLLPQGFRSVINTGDAAGQTVHHIHLHLLGGEPLEGRLG